MARKTGKPSAGKKKPAGFLDNLAQSFTQGVAAGKKTAARVNKLYKVSKTVKGIGDQVTGAVQGAVQTVTDKLNEAREGLEQRVSDQQGTSFPVAFAELVKSVMRDMKPAERKCFLDAVFKEFCRECGSNDICDCSRNGRDS